MNKLGRREYIQLVANSLVSIYGEKLKIDGKDVRMARKVIQVLNDFLNFKDSDLSQKEFTLWKKSRQTIDRREEDYFDSVCLKGLVPITITGSGNLDSQSRDNCPSYLVWREAYGPKPISEVKTMLERHIDNCQGCRDNKNMLIEQVAKDFKQQKKIVAKFFNQQEKS